MKNATLEQYDEAINEVLRSLSIESDIVFCKRISTPTTAQVKFSIEHAIHMAQTNGLKKYLIDARGTLPPSATLRKALRELINCFIGHFDAMVIVVDENPTLQVSAQFIFHNHELPENIHFKMCTSMEEGLQFLSQH